MSEARQPKKEVKTSESENRLRVPTISLPNGGGAMRGIGEKFAANPVTGTGSLTIPIAISPGRSGFTPQLSLVYDSGKGNGFLGFGWNIFMPSITRKTEKGLPQYHDEIDSDVFILSGTEDLVPVFESGPDGGWLYDSIGHPVFDEKERGEYIVRRYRPRVEGLFACIERWTRRRDHEVHWRSISRDNILTVYGRDVNSRIADPENPLHVFSWLICESYDDKGNAVMYEYAEENEDGIDQSQANENNRVRTSNRYPKRIKYGNRRPMLLEPARPGQRLSHIERPDLASAGWMFEVVFDYGEGYYQAFPGSVNDPMRVHAGMNAATVWPVRLDSFSSYRAGFEIRTQRLCRRVLMFHHFPAELGAQDYLVCSTTFEYRESPIASFISSVTQSGYTRLEDGSYLKKSLPPLELKYSTAQISDIIHHLDDESADNLPIGIDGTLFQWVDLDGEGASGILTEQADGWHYKRNLSPNNHSLVDDREQTYAQFGPKELVLRKPTGGLTGGVQFLDLAGDGQVDLVHMDELLAGFYERTNDADWEEFKPFTSWPNVNLHDPNLRFIDLTGDGCADILITEGEVLTCYPSLGEDGFGPSIRQNMPADAEHGPRLVFNDNTQSLYLADMSGDGLADLVRIRNGEICYWPNLGYGRFGERIIMDDAPWFDIPDQFDQRRVRVADINGSGTTDVLYLGQDFVRVYFNQSGNSWSAFNNIPFPPVDNLTVVQTVDLLGNGTACLVWSSSLPSEAGHSMRYIDLMGGQKPYLLTEVRNNLGVEIEIQYAPSTKFYLADKYAGKPWITHLPFPVHCVERIVTRDKWRGTTFSTRYGYHHGFFDGIEREFRGFGRVEQVDVETFDRFSEGNSASPYITDDKTLYQPPIKIVTWYHTGSMLDRERILSCFNKEYFPNSFESLYGWAVDGIGGFKENILPEPDFDGTGLSTEEWREGLRACKGMVLRQEVYELDVDALATGEHRPVKLFSATQHNCHILRLQERAVNPHAVFLVTESESITYQYELDLRSATLRPDPRVAHTFNLRVDEYGNILQSVAVVYPRFGRHRDAALPDGVEERIAQVQQEMHMVYTETHYTNDVLAADNYRLRVPCELKTYELTGFSPLDEDDRLSSDRHSDRYFTLEALRAYRLSEVYQVEGTPIPEIAYHELPDRTVPQMRLIEQVRTLYFSEDLMEPLIFGRLNALGLTYESYKLALTEAFLAAVFAPDQLTGEVRAGFSNPAMSGYLSGPELTRRFPDAAGQYWLRSGTAGFESDAAEHFYLPECYTDPFGNLTRLTYDPYDLYLQSSTDPAGNMTSIDTFNFRLLAPQRMRDINDNLSEVAFDALGMPIAMAVMGKGDECDNLMGFDDALLDPDLETRLRIFTGDYNEAEARRLLGNATARFLYYFGESRDAAGQVTYGSHPTCACGILREKHLTQLDPGEASLLQVGFEYSDGTGKILVKKSQAEPETEGGPLRWLANGKTILNNKGKPVKQYEPYFSSNDHHFEELREVGVTHVMYYDAPGRLIRTEAPDGSYSRVEFSPWHVTTYDATDTVLEPGNVWYARNTAATAPAEQRRAARLAAMHAGTPASVFLDSLGREVVGLVHNRLPDEEPALANVPFEERLWHDEKNTTFTRLDTEGKPLWIRDPRGNLVMQYITPQKPTRWADESNEDVPSGSMPCYDIAGNLLFQHSMDSGDRWTLPDAAGKPLYGWDVNERVGEAGEMIPEERLFHTVYDELRRPLEQRLRIDGGDWQVIEKFEYGESLTDAGEAHHLNLRGQVREHCDPAGRVTNVSFDFKGNLLESRRQLAHDYDAEIIDWSTPTTRLEDETFTRITEFDALNRMVRLYNWHKGVGSRVAVYEPRYNRRGLLAGEALIVGATKSASGYETSDSTQRTDAVVHITYNAMGQREHIEYGNPTVTEYTYDPETFRLVRLTTAKTDGSVMQDLQYTYDPVGNITAIHDGAQQTVFFANSRIAPHCHYIYDGLYRLIQAQGREHAAQNNVQRDGRDFDLTPEIPFPNSPEALQNYTERYVYDAAGNILSMRHIGGTVERWTRRYQYAEDSNRLLGTSLPGDDPSTYSSRYAYDTHGSMLNLANVPADYHTRWDYRDMIHSLDLGGGGWVYYNYDSGKQRTRKVVTNRDDARQWERLYLGGMELYRRRDVRGDIVEEIETHHLFVDDQRVLIIEDVLETDNLALGPGILYRYQYGNHLGSVGMELNAVAGIISYEEYHPYGTTAYRATGSDVRATAKRYRYTGMERDEESGLSYHTARYYAPWLGRWGSADPAGLVAGSNLYRYTRNNTIRSYDPNGMQPLPPPPFRTSTGLHPESFIGDSPTAASNWQDATIDILSRRYTAIVREGDESAASYRTRLIEAYHRELGELPRGSNRSGTGTQIGLARYLFGRITRRFWRLEADRPSFDYTDEELARMGRGTDRRVGRAPLEDVQIHHGLGRHLSRYPEEAFNPTSLRISRGHAGSTGTMHARDHRAEVLLESGHPNPGLMAQEEMQRAGDIYFLIDPRTVSRSGGSSGGSGSVSVEGLEELTESIYAQIRVADFVIEAVDEELAAEEEEIAEEEEMAEEERGGRRARYEGIPPDLLTPEGEMPIYIFPIGIPIGGLLAPILELFGVAPEVEATGAALYGAGVI